MQKLYFSLLFCSLLFLGLSPAAFAEAHVSAAAVIGTRYEVFMTPALLPGCNPTTLTFRPDFIFKIDCMDGFGLYVPLGNFFAGFFHAPGFYLGKDVTFFVSGFVLDPLFFAVGLTYIGNDREPVALVGYTVAPQE
jgi:hypothetical protein